MSELNKLFVCSQCGHSIAPQMDNLEFIILRLKTLLNEFEKLKKEIENLSTTDSKKES